MLNQNSLNKLKEIKNNFIEFNKSKPFLFLLLQTFIIIIIVVLIIASFSIINNKSNLDKENYRAEAIKKEISKIYDAKFNELKIKYKNLEDQQKALDLEISRERNDKINLSNSSKKVTDSESKKMNELNYLKNKNDLKGYSDELIKNLGY
jgi:HD superfamily phosphohydrolase